MKRLSKIIILVIITLIITINSRVVVGLSPLRIKNPRYIRGNMIYKLLKNPCNIGGDINSKLLINNPALKIAQNLIKKSYPTIDKLIQIVETPKQNFDVNYSISFNLAGSTDVY